MPTDLNPFLDNIFTPQGGGRGSARRPGSPIGQVQFPGQTPPFAAPQQSVGWGDVAGDALGGLGTYMTNNANTKMTANEQNNRIRSQQSNLYQRQGENAQGAALDVLHQSPAGSDIEPFANMALRRALIGSFSTPQIQAPAGIPTGKLSGGIDLEALKPVMDQYFSDNAIRSSMQHQQSLRNAVDPDTPQATAGLQIFGSQEGDSYQPNYDAAVGEAGAARNRRDFTNDNAQLALRQAIEANIKASKGSIGGALLSALLGGGKTLLTGGMF
jgi:hypothetical protein